MVTIEKRSSFIERVLAAGHQLQLDEEGQINIFAMSIDFHNGPMCIKCHDTWCMHCGDSIRVCPGLND